MQEAPGAPEPNLDLFPRDKARGRTQPPSPPSKDSMRTVLVAQVAGLHQSTWKAEAGGL